MKKFLFLLLALVLSVSVSCSDDKTGDTGGSMLSVTSLFVGSVRCV